MANYAIQHIIECWISNERANYEKLLPCEHSIRILFDLKHWQFSMYVLKCSLLERINSLQVYKTIHSHHLIYKDRKKILLHSIRMLFDLKHFSIYVLKCFLLERINSLQVYIMCSKDSFSSPP